MTVPKLLLLTTQTLHHAYFVREIRRVFPDLRVILETDSRKAPFETHHPFESKREEYEQESLFGLNSSKIETLAKTRTFSSVNSPECLAEIEQLRPDITFVFGTGLVRPLAIRLLQGKILNLHGGDPEEYRGLDTHLWAIYHKDFGQIITTLHHLNQNLDDGDIILQMPVPLSPGMELHTLRKANTDVCIQLCFGAVGMFERTGSFVSRPQRRRGRYYSAMPTSIKDVCVRNFQNYIEGLK